MTFEPAPWDHKRADKIVVGDWLPINWYGTERQLEVVKVEPKRKLVWITIEEPATGERWIQKSAFATELPFKEGATVSDEFGAWAGEKD